MPIDDADSVACPFCAAVVKVPGAHRKAVILTRQEDDQIAAAEQAWRALERWTMPRSLVFALTLPAGAALLIGFTLAAAKTWGVSSTGLSARQVLGWVAFVPLAPSLVLAMLAVALRPYAQQVPLLRAQLAARAGQHQPECRSCRAPVRLRPGALLVRCPYCRTDNLVTLAAVDERALAASAASAQESVLEAIAKLRDRASEALAGLSYLPAVGLLALLPALWAFAGAPWAAGWSRVVAFNVCLLALVVFMHPLHFRGALYHEDKASAWSVMLGVLLLAAMVILPALFWWIAAGVGAFDPWS